VTPVARNKKNQTRKSRKNTGDLGGNTTLNRLHFEENCRPFDRMKRCKHFYCIRVDVVEVPEQFQRNTKLPGDPRGDQRTGFGLFRRELLTLAMQDKRLGGNPVIRKVPVMSASG
jgi:hypothetical protein